MGIAEIRRIEPERTVTLLGDVTTVEDRITPRALIQAWRSTGVTVNDPRSNVRHLPPPSRTMPPPPPGARVGEVRQMQRPSERDVRFSSHTRTLADGRMIKVKGHSRTLIDGGKQLGQSAIALGGGLAIVGSSLLILANGVVQMIGALLAVAGTLLALGANAANTQAAKRKPTKRPAARPTSARSAARPSSNRPPARRSPQASRR